MADIIQLLPDSIANQIAAGEVIQRPASVIKELMENAIDAGSTVINIIIKDAGKSLIQVIDNGKGMSETDARLSFERHATSKIRNSEDLFHIKTMGFRGEALASVAAIAQVEMKTKRKEDELGTRIVIEASDFKLQEPCQAATGTNIAIRNLFYNVPARRKFLKSDIVELRHIHDEFQRIALAYPGIFFNLHHDQSEMYHLQESNLRQRIVNMFGSNINGKLVPVEEKTEALNITGFIGKPEYAKRTRGEQYFFVNGRYIKSPYLNHAILAGYEGLLPDDTFPLYAIFLEINPSAIDVNVHPTKQEIKFENEKLVYNYLSVAVKHALGKHSLTPMLDFEQEQSMSSYDMAHTYKKENKEGNTGQYIPDRNPNIKNWESLYQGFQGRKEPVNLPSDAAFTIETQWSGPETIDASESIEQAFRKDPYQVHNCYIINQIKSGFLLVDQNAAHERILYEHYRAALHLNQGLAIQNLLFPQNIQLSTGDYMIAIQVLPQMNQLGFDIREFGGNTLIIHGMPAEIDAAANPQALVESMINLIKEELDLKHDSNENIARALARQAAVKRGKQLSVIEMKELIDKLFACEMPFKSPSGKKCFITFELEDLDKMFY